MASWFPSKVEEHTSVTAGGQGGLPSDYEPLGVPGAGVVQNYSRPGGRSTFKILDDLDTERFAKMPSTPKTPRKPAVDPVGDARPETASVLRRAFRLSKRARRHVQTSVLADAQSPMLSLLSDLHEAEAARHLALASRHKKLAEWYRAQAALPLHKALRDTCN